MKTLRSISLRASLAIAATLLLVAPSAADPVAPQRAPHGLRAVVQAEPTERVKAITPAVMQQVRSALQRRFEVRNLARPAVTILDTHRLAVELPRDMGHDDAVRLLCTQNVLTFRARESDLRVPRPEWSADESEPWVATGLDGSMIAKAAIRKGVEDWAVTIDFDAAGTAKLRALTQHLLHRPLGIYLDETLLIAPMVHAPITDGQVQIAQSYTKAQAKALAAVLRAGSLPVPLTLVEIGL